MSIKRYVADKDTTITNAFLPNLVDRAEDANMGASDSLEIFSIYGQAYSNSLEKSRILVQFPVADIKTDRSNSKVPASGSVKFFLRMFNVEHPYSVPRDFKTIVSVVSQSWDEGYGLDMESYSDKGWGVGTKGSGTNWKYCASGSSWNTEGGTFLTSSAYNFEVPFKSGLEDIEIDITNVVEGWITSSIENNGFLIRMSGSYEDGTTSNSFYTKKFSARGSEYFYKRPVIEARWEAVSTDDRGNFFAKSDALSDADNTMSIYFYNKVNGRLKNIVNDPAVLVKLYTDEAMTDEITPDFVQVTNPIAGVYKAKIIVDTTASALYDQWYFNTSSYFQGSLDVLQRANYDYDYTEEYVVNITNNKHIYGATETARFNIFIRERDWQPTIYTKAYNTIENTALQDLYYKIFRLNDNYVVVDYSTGSLAYTKTSYDSNGNYFELDMSILEKDYNYGVKLARWNGSELKEIPTTFKFKVE
jgi:hypothetical protein